MSEVITVTIAPDGSTKVDVDGMQGSSCATATHEIELVLGGQGKRKEKPEWSLPDVAGFANVSNSGGRL